MLVLRRLGRLGRLGRCGAYPPRLAGLYEPHRRHREYYSLLLVPWYNSLLSLSSLDSPPYKVRGRGGGAFGGDATTGEDYFRVEPHGGVQPAVLTDAVALHWKETLTVLVT